VPRDDLLRERITPSGNMPLYWCNGLLFSFSSIPMTEEIIRDYLRGKVHWLEIHFSKEAKYTPILTLNEEEYKATMNIRVIDTSKSNLHVELTKWLKTKINSK
jgi:hypothetical protein